MTKKGSIRQVEKHTTKAGSPATNFAPSTCQRYRLSVLLRGNGEVCKNIPRMRQRAEIPSLLTHIPSHRRARARCLRLGQTLGSTQRHLGLLTGHDFGPLKDRKKGIECQLPLVYQLHVQYADMILPSNTKQSTCTYLPFGFGVSAHEVYMCERLTRSSPISMLGLKLVQWCNSGIALVTSTCACPALPVVLPRRTPLTCLCGYFAACNVTLM